MMYSIQKEQECGYKKQRQTIYQFFSHVSQNCFKVHTLSVFMSQRRDLQHIEKSRVWFISTHDVIDMPRRRPGTDWATDV